MKLVKIMENATISNTELYAIKDKFDNVSKELEKINKNYSDLITKIIKNNKIEELQKIFDIIEHFKKEGMMVDYPSDVIVQFVFGGV